MVAEVILAKSPIHGQQISLSEHVTTVSNAAQYLFGSPGQPTRLGTEWLRFFGLTSGQFPEFLTNLQLAALFHDLGKANDGFQFTLRHRGQQAIRHEHLSALLLYLEPIRDWLCRSGTAGIDFETILSAVVSHHLKVNDQEFAKRLLPGVDTFTVFTRDADFVKCLRLAERIVGSPPPDLSAYDRLWSFEHDVDPRKGPSGDFGRSMHNFKRKLQKGSERHRLLVAVKAGLIAADSAGSALIREGRSLGKWISGCFEFDPLTADWVENKIIRPRIKEIERKSGRTFEWHDFQIAAGELGQRALLLSGCGTGKTLAAWKWIAKQLSEKPASRVLFLYPTRSTATEGFRDYVSWAGGEDATLLHGTATYDLAGIFPNPGDPRHGGDYHVQERLFALGYWPKRVFSATVDSFLAFVRNQYASLCLLPVLADSVVVVDEVHSFDRRMFTALEWFLKFFNIPVLCMTASLPPDRLELLRDGCGLQVFPHSKDEFEDLQRQSESERYNLSVVEEGKLLDIVKDAVANDKKVLWVVNTVSRCQERARDLKAHIAESGRVLCYHSRFKLCDRRRHHNRVVQEFDKGTVVVATQVCEMSLNLDADVLITEIAPVPSIIQRMGRCCREPVPRNRRIGQVYVYLSSDVKPYDKKEVEAGKIFVEMLTAGKKQLCHADLSNYLATMQVTDPFIEGGYTGFLDAGPYAMAQDESFREGEDFTVDCVLDSEIDDYLARRRVADPETDGYVVPVPRRFARENSMLGQYLREAHETQYHPEFGFLDEAKTLWLKK